MELRPYSVLGTDLRNGLAMVPNAEVGPYDVVVDPAGLRFVRGNRPWDAGGASKAIYEYYGIDGGFPRGLKDELKE
eukprot:8825668-Alexandrium_andersonii.AAC.1